MMQTGLKIDRHGQFSYRRMNEWTHICMTVSRSMLCTQESIGEAKPSADGRPLLPFFVD